MNPEGIIETLKRALAFYASEDTYLPQNGALPAIDNDQGKIAQITLGIVATVEANNKTSVDTDLFNDLEILTP